MAETEPPTLLHVYEVEVEDRTAHVIGFLEPEIAQKVGIYPDSIVGEFQPDPNGEFDPESFVPNRAFIEAFERYMNQEVVKTPELMVLAQQKPGETLALIDPRHPEGEEDPVPQNIVGRFEVDIDGWIKPDSFQYNPNHIWFDATHGVSGVFQNQEFYDWLTESHGAG